MWVLDYNLECLYFNNIYVLMGKKRRPFRNHRQTLPIKSVNITHECIEYTSSLLHCNYEFRLLPDKWWWWNEFILNLFRRGRDHMVVGFTTTCAISAYHHQSCDFESRSGEEYSIPHYVIKCVSDLRQVDGFPRSFCFPPPIKLTATI